jgi:hypothetical protein
VDRREHGEVVPEGVLPVCKPEGGLASRGGVASSAAKGVGLEGSALRGAQLTPVAASEGLSESLQAPERDVLRDVKFEGPEVVRVRQGVLLEPEAAGEVAPAGGAGYEEGEGEQGFFLTIDLLLVLDSCCSACSLWLLQHSVQLLVCGQQVNGSVLCSGRNRLWLCCVLQRAGSVART